MAGGNITRIIGGSNTIETENWEVFTEDFHAYARKGSHFTADGGTIIGEPKDFPEESFGSVKYLTKGWWTDVNNKPINKIYFGHKVKFHIQFKKLPNYKNASLWIQFKEKDTIIHTDLRKPKTFDLKNGSTSLIIDFNLSFDLEDLAHDSTENGKEIELFAQAFLKFDDDSFTGAYTERKNLGFEDSENLIVQLKPVKIAVIIEDSNWLAGSPGHTGIAINGAYRDYGPFRDLNLNGIDGIEGEKQVQSGILNEKDYNYDFDKNGKIEKIKKKEYEINTFNAPGGPYWANKIAYWKYGGYQHVKKVTLSDIEQMIKLKRIGAKKKYDIELNEAKIKRCEFEVSEGQAIKIRDYWDTLYRVKGRYHGVSHQCTSTVVESLVEAGVMDALSKAREISPHSFFVLPLLENTCGNRVGMPCIETIIN